MVPLLLCFLLLSLLCNALEEIDFQTTKNQEALHTSKYQITAKDVLVVRRAATFVIKYQLPPSSVEPSLIFTPVADFKGSKLSQNGANPLSLPFLSGPSPGWGFWNVDGDTQLVNIPANASVGIYSVDLNLYNTTSKTSHVLTQSKILVVLCNPWAQDDLVYMADDNERHEYVEAKQGAMWLNRYSSPTGWSWDQYSEDVLAVSLSFLNHLGDFGDRSDLVKISRAFSALMNVNDRDGGLLYGRWQEPYDEGKVPWSWTGSGEIFSEYRKTGTAVKWGQCWVFAGVLVSASRTLGIPARQITNFASAHEDGSLGPYRMSIDFFSDENGKPITNFGSIWNFHAWSEVWFARSDIQNANGWQVVDATPQERSEGYFQLGPSSINSIRGRNLDASFDTAFVVSEVSAAVRQYVNFNTGRAQHPLKKGFYLSEENLDQTGQMISTKAVGSLDRHDLTSEYKKSSSGPARVLFHSANSKNYKSAEQDVIFSVTDTDTVSLGDALFVKVAMTCPRCTLHNNKTVQISETFEVYTYNGELLDKVKSDLHYTMLSDATPKIIGFSLTVQEYEHLLSDASFIQSNLFAKVYHHNHNFTGQYYSHVKRFDVEIPSINLNIKNATEDEVTVVIDFLNPLPTTLTNAYMTIYGAHVVTRDEFFGTIETGVQTEIVVKISEWPVTNECYIFVRLWTEEVSFFEGQVVVTLKDSKI